MSVIRGGGGREEESLAWGRVPRPRRKWGDVYISLGVSVETTLAWPERAGGLSTSRAPSRREAWMSRVDQAINAHRLEMVEVSRGEAKETTKAIQSQRGLE